jgi:hypothetical protein
MLHFTDQERAKLERLRMQVGKKFDEICVHLAGKSSRRQLAEQIWAQAEVLIEAWGEEVEGSGNPKPKAVTPIDPVLQRLLAEHQVLSECICNIQDEAMERDFRAVFGRAVK